jgi:hypothetical protein
MVEGASLSAAALTHFRRCSHLVSLVMGNPMDVDFPEDKVKELDKLLLSLDPTIVQCCENVMKKSEGDLHDKVESVIGFLWGLSFEEQGRFPILVQEAVFGENNQNDHCLVSERLGGMNGPLRLSHILLAACETSM